MGFIGADFGIKSHVLFILAHFVPLVEQSAAVCACYHYLGYF